MRRSRRRRWRPSAQAPGLWWLALMALVGVSGVLAALQIGEEPQRTQPWERRGLGRQERLS